jgi:hypothetical protein
MKTVMLWTLALLMLAAPGAAEAITVSIQATRGTTIATLAPGPAFTDSAGKPAVALACTTTQAGVANSTAGTTACSRTISVGGTTVTIRDVSVTNRARVYRVDGLSSDILNLAGLLATSGAGITTTTGVTLKINYSSNEYTALVYNLYAYTAAMSGNFFNATGGTPSACAPAPAPPCVTLKLTANNVTVNQFGDNAVATVNVPPLGTGGAFGPPTLNPSETKSIACGISGSTALTCTPSLQGELTTIYKGPSETLKVVGGAALGASNNAITTHGVIDTFVDVVAPETSTALDVFVDYTQEATLHALLVQDGGRFPMLQQGANLPLWWNLEKVDQENFTPTAATLLRSIVSNDDLFDDGAYVSWVPTPGQIRVKEISSLVASFDWGELGDCSGSWFVELQLQTLQVIRIFLGGSADFLTQCDTNVFSGVDLVAFGGKNVQLPDGTFTTYKSMLTKLGGNDLRAVSVFLTARINPVRVDQEVALTSFTIGAFKTTFPRAGGRTPNFVDLKCDFPGVNEFTMRVTPVDANHNPVGPSFIWGDGPGETFVKAQDQPVAGDCQLRTQIPVNNFPAFDRESGWRFELLYNLVPVGQGDVNLF